MDIALGYYFTAEFSGYVKLTVITSQNPAGKLSDNDVVALMFFPCDYLSAEIADWFS